MKVYPQGQAPEDLDKRRVEKTRESDAEKRRSERRVSIELRKAERKAREAELRKRTRVIWEVHHHRVNPETLRLTRDICFVCESEASGRAYIEEHRKPLCDHDCDGLFFLLPINVDGRGDR